MVALVYLLQQLNWICWHWFSP